MIDIKSTCENTPQDVIADLTLNLINYNEQSGSNLGPISTRGTERRLLKCIIVLNYIMRLAAMPADLL
jgi:hypothetical protein